MREVLMSSSGRFKFQIHPKPQSDQVRVAEMKQIEKNPIYTYSNKLELSLFR